MSVLTLAQFEQRTRLKLERGIAQTILTVNPSFTIIPWIGYQGSGIIVNQEATEADAGFYGLDDTITHKAPGTVDPFTATATRVIGDAELDEKQIAESNSDINNLLADEVAAKAKKVGRLIQGGMVNGDGALPNMHSMHTETDAGLYIASAGGNILDELDHLCTLPTAKDGFVDFLMVNYSVALKVRQAYRALGGVPMMEVKSGDRTIKVIDFNGIPMYVNQFIGSTETAGGAALTGGNLTSAYAGCWDDGTKKTGVALIYPEKTPMGIAVERIGSKHDKDQRIIRVKSYVDFVNFNKTSVARLTDIAV